MEYHLFEEGYRTRKGVLFDDVAVRRILTNPVYCAVDDASIAFFEERKCEVIAEKGSSGDIGFMPYNRTNQQRELQTMDKWLVSAGAHKPLISSENWIRVQKILEGNSAEYARYAHRKKTDCKPIPIPDRREANSTAKARYFGVSSYSSPSPYKLKVRSGA